MVKDKTKTKVVKAKADNKNKTVAELRADLLITQKSLHDGTLTNPHAIKSIKKEIARKLTAENAARIEAAGEPKAKAKAAKAEDKKGTK